MSSEKSMLTTLSSHEHHTKNRLSLPSHDIRYINVFISLTILLGLLNYGPTHNIKYTRVSSIQVHSLYLNCDNVGTHNMRQIND